MADDAEKVCVPRLELAMNKDAEVKVALTKIIRVRTRSNVKGSFAYVNG